MTRFNRVAEMDIRFSSGQPNFNLLGSINIKNLRIAFQIRKNITFSTNQANIQIYNLSPETRAKINNYGDEIRLSAGYSEESGVQLIFVGDTSQVSHLFEQPDIISSFLCGDGERIITQQKRQVSYAENISARTVIQNIADLVGLEIAYFAPTANLEYKQGYQNAGLVKDLLEDVASYLGLSATVQNQKLYLIPKQGTTERPPFEISQNTGMIGVPQRYTYSRLDLWKGGSRAGYKVKTLLRPEILPGDRIRLISQRINLDQLFYVDGVTHVGDTRGEAWFSNWELIEIG